MRAVIVGTATGMDADDGQMTNISFNNITSHYADTVLRLTAKLEDCAFNDIKQANTDDVIYEGVYTLINNPLTNARYIL